MAQTIQIKRSSATATPTSLSAGELAYSDSSDKLFIGQPSNNTVVTIGGKAFTDKLDGIDPGANNYILPLATSTVRGGVELFSDTDQTVSANAVTTTANRTYGIQLNSDDQMVVNVPWTDTVYTLPIASSSTLGGVKIGSGISITNGVISADSVTTSAVEAAGALMDSEVTNLQQVKDFDSSDYATAAQGTLATNALPKSGGTMTGDLEFGDGDKIKLGDSGDLKIFHAANRSAIMDEGTGNLDITTNGTDISLRGGNDNNDMLKAISNDAVELFYSGQKKFETTNTGTEVTGNIVVSGTVDGRDLATDGNKLDGISAGADVTPSWVPSTNPNYLTSFTETFDSSDAGNFTFSGNQVELSSGGTMTLGASNGSEPISIPGSLTISGNLNVTGDVNSTSQNNLDVTDKLITVGVGQSGGAASSGSGIKVDGADARLLWSSTQFEIDDGDGNLHGIIHEGNSATQTYTIDGGTF